MYDMFSHWWGQIGIQVIGELFTGTCQVALRRSAVGNCLVNTAEKKEVMYEMQVAGFKSLSAG